MIDDAAATAAGDSAEFEGSSSFSQEDLAGKSFAGCQIVRKLGQGAMGAVYLAEQDSLRRTVAFKVLDPKFSRDITYIERFEREAQAAARLLHYNIVQVFDYGREDEIYYIVNEYVDGGNVQDLIDAEGVLTPSQAVDIALQTCRGLAVAQENDVIHRDIKPENLMLTKAGKVKIADFGLAKVVSDDAAVTQSGMIVGTPFYMSPEQAKGLTLDNRSDLYSLGVSLFYMLTGQIPFDADSVIGVLLKQISAERPDPVGINPNVPTALGQTVMRMMARDPDERYQTFKEMVDVFERFLDQIKRGSDSMHLKVPTVPVDRSARYKLLRKSRIMAMKRREVSDEAARQMMDLLKGDAGVFVETTEPYKENSIVEVRFSVPGREGLFRGIGVVRWVDAGGDPPGMGITFLKVSTVPKTPGRAAVGGRRESTRSVAGTGRGPSMGPAAAIQALTQTPLHCRLLRYFYANTGQTVEVKQIANALGIGTRMLDRTIKVYEQLGLVRVHTNGQADLQWPEDKGVQREIVNWVSKYGLL